MTIDIDKLEALAKAAPAGQWEVWTSNSWRRVYANQGREKVCVIEPTTQHDRWPDLMFGPGVPEYLEGVTPDLVLALIAEVRALREDAERYRWIRDVLRLDDVRWMNVANWYQANISAEIWDSEIDAARKGKA
jgi:hypothetical protein